MKNVHTILHKIFDDAIDRNFAVNNPAHKVKIEGGRDSVERVMPDPSDVEKTFANLDTAFQVLLLTYAFTGLRRGELLGLRWQDVELDVGVLRVRKQVQRVKRSLLNANAFQNVERIGSTGLALVTLKSKRSVRSIEMPPYLVTLLGQHKNQNAGAFVFHDEFGNPLDPKAVYKPLYVAEDEAQVPRFSPHGLRYLYCSVLQESGASVKHAQQRMGHASATTTMNIYTRSVTDEGRKYAEKVEAAFPFVSQLLADVSATDSGKGVIQ
jgi:integrase